MSIHTAEISAEVPVINDDVFEPLHIWLRRFEFSERQIQRVIDPSNRDSVTITRYLMARHPNLGIEKVTFIKTQDESNPPKYFIIFRINPQLMIMRRRTVELFSPSVENNERFFTAFQEAMSTFDDNWAINDIANFNCARLDMTHDFRFETSEQAKLFMRIIHRTSRYIRSREQKRIKGLSILNQSAAEANKSYKIICYDKQQQVRRTYRGVPPDEMNILLSQVENVVRYEIQCGKRKIYYLKKSNNFQSRSFWYYLNENIIHRNLQKAFHETIGEGNFCYLYRAQQRINNAEMRPSTRNKLNHFLHLISQVGCLSEGKRQFLRGRTIRVDGEDVHVQGTEPTYYSRLRMLRGLGINPVTIPNHWATEFHIQELPNPYGELLI